MDRNLHILKDGLLQIGLRPSLEVCARLVWYLEEMLRWNRRINLTAIRSFDEALEKHLVDSLTLVPMLKGDEKLLDMGSGAGLPSLPLKIFLPELQVVSVDSVQKKVAFQQHVARNLGLQGFTVIARRLEEVGHEKDFVGNFSVVTARAVTHLMNLVTLARPFLMSGGRLLALKGPEAERELKESAEVVENNGLEVEKVQRLQLPMSGAKRIVLILKHRDDNHVSNISSP